MEEPVNSFTERTGTQPRPESKRAKEAKDYKRAVSTQINRRTGTEFPGSPVVRTPAFTAEGLGSILVKEPRIPHKRGRAAKNKRQERQRTSVTLALCYFTVHLSSFQ